MANEADLGQEAEEFFRDLALIEQRRRSQKYYYTGLCWNCGEPLEDGSFCDADCQHDYETRKRMAR